MFFDPGSAADPGYDDRVILGFVEKLEQHGGHPSATRIQKGLFFVKAGLCVPFGFDYPVYKHGPFSRALETRVGGLVDQEHLRLQPGTGRSRGHYSVARGKRLRAPCERQLDFVARSIAYWPASKLEAVMTTLWLRHKFPTFDAGEIRSVLHKMKPHLDMDDGKAAAVALDRLMEQAIQQGMIYSPPTPVVDEKTVAKALMRERVMELKHEREAPTSLREIGEISREIEEVMGGRPPTSGWQARPGAR